MNKLDTSKYKSDNISLEFVGCTLEELEKELEPAKIVTHKSKKLYSRGYIAPSKTKKINCKLSRQDAAVIRRKRTLGWTYSQLANTYNVSVSHIINIVQKRVFK